MGSLDEKFRQPISRREFIKLLTRAGLVLYTVPFGASLLKLKEVHGAIGETRGLREALFYYPIDGKTVQCLLCPRNCTLPEGVRSFCRVRENHMLPGTLAYSIATAGCNLRCKFCQNWQISQAPPEETNNIVLTCRNVVENAKASKCGSIAYTYSEPNIFYEYAIDTAKIAKREGIKNIFVTAGYINPEPLNELCYYLDAANVDLKGFDEKYLREICAQRLGPLLDALLIYRKRGVWLEITNLIVPTLNDDMATIKKMCIWIKENLGKETPLHFSRFWPMYKLKNLYPTPLETLLKAKETAKEVGLDYVYIGNVRHSSSNNTYCPRCNKLLIERSGYMIIQNNITKSKCKFCAKDIPGIWEEPLSPRSSSAPLRDDISVAG